MPFVRKLTAEVVVQGQNVSLVSRKKTPSDGRTYRNIGKLEGGLNEDRVNEVSQCIFGRLDYSRTGL